MTTAESSTSCNAMTILTHEEFAAKHRHPPNPDNVRIARRDVTPSIDNRMPKPKPKPSENPPETVRTPSDDGEDPMEEDRVPTGRTLRRRKEKVVKHLKRGTNEKEKENFRKRVFRIPLDKPFEEAYYTHRLVNAHRPEASSSIDRRNKKSTDIHHRTSVNDATIRGRLVPKMTSDMSDTHYHGEEFSADTYATLRRHQFNLESLEERLQRMENTAATTKKKWHRGDEAMRDFAGKGLEHDLVATTIKACFANNPRI
ncbi:hypothetical protein F2Q69_00006971 [Brassica cretica]|uniref:Uncharacterized protein n=1 Tax=Brassica cretica TaxID=69181 RepID=A0A8S9P374_BRACR|nr:hypothetical protein F2Q69_00006971 [Brassica cretica]